MIRLAVLFYGVVASTLASVSVVAALVARWDSLWLLLGAAGTGAILGAPVAWFVAKALWGGDEADRPGD